jgi:hypothetical protein
MQPSTSIYRDVKDGRYIVQPYTKGPVATTAFGEPTIVAENDFGLRIADAVFANLDRFGKEAFEKSRAIRRSPNEQKQFLAQHLGVSVCRQESGGGLIIYPLHREGGGMVGSDDDFIVLAESDLPQKLAEAIAEAFRRAT